MLGMDQYEMIRTAHRKYGKKIRELSREYGHHRETIRKILLGREPRYRRRKAPPNPVMDPVSDLVGRWLKEDKERPSKQRHTAVRIYKRLVEECDFEGSESTVRRWVRHCKAELGFGRSEAMIPLDPDAAREAEVDWGTAHVIMNGEKRKVKFFCMRSRYSGKLFVQAYSRERQEMFFDGHMRAFEYFNGVFPVLVYDNLKTAVYKILRGKQRREQGRFFSFRSYYTFEARYCTPGQGHEKGGVEGGLGYARRNFMVPLPEVKDFEELNQLLLDRCAEDSLRILRGREEERTIEERHKEEQPTLLKLPGSRFENIKLTTVRISKYQTATVDRNRYSVPTAYVGRELKVHLCCWTVRLYDGTRLVGEHERVFGNSKWQINPLHYLEIIRQRVGAFDSARAIRGWRKEWPAVYEKMLTRLVLRHGDNKGKREFVRILQLHQDYPKKQIEEAVGQALDSRAYGCDVVKHLLQIQQENAPDIVSLPKDLMPGVTDCAVEPSDVRRYGELLSGGVL